jgi:hypothetical protein
MAIDHEDSGYLVPVGDESAFIHTLARAASQVHSQSGLRRAAQNQAVHWSWAWIAQRVEAHWAQALKSRRSSLPVL